SGEFRRYAQYAQLGTSLLFLKFSRDAERQSDKLGVEYSTKVGYDAREMASFFTTLERLSGQEGAAIPDFLSTHPNPGERANRVERLAKSHMGNDQNYQIGRNEYLSKIDGMVYGQNPRKGFTDLGHFYHPELAFQFPYPEGWNLVNSNSLVQIAPEDNSALIQFLLSDESEFDRVTQMLSEQFEMEIVDYTDKQINGLPARMLSIQIQAEDQVIPGLVHMIKYDNNTYVFLSLAAESDFARYRDNFIRTAEGFRELDDSGILNIQPDRLSVRKAAVSGTLRQILSSQGVSQLRMEEHAIINGMNLDDMLAEGTFYKVIVKG
ncbi:MAG: M48 family metalloprotease, partial [Cyclobacteriaceae bacterium]